MYIKRLFITSAIAVLVSAVLLGFYWLYTRFRLKDKNRTDERDKFNHALETYLDSIPAHSKSRFNKLILVKNISSAMLIVSLCFFIVGGIIAESSPEEFGRTSADPAIQIAFFGWFLWGFSLVSMFISEGAAAITTKGVVAKNIPGITRKRFIAGKKAINFGVRQILIGIGFLVILLYAMISILYL